MVLMSMSHIRHLYLVLVYCVFAVKPLATVWDVTLRRSR